MTIKEEYDKLLESGMFWEFHPELSGNWLADEEAFTNAPHRTLTIKRADEPSILTLFGKGEEILKFEQDGKIFVRGKLITEDMQIVEGFRDFLKLQGFNISSAAKTFKFTPGDILPETKRNVLIKYKKGSASPYSNGKKGEFLIEGYYEERTFDWSSIPQRVWYDYTGRQLYDLDSKSKNKIIEWAYID